MNEELESVNQEVTCLGSNIKCQSGSEDPDVPTYVAFLYCQSSATTAVSPHSRAPSQGLEIGFRMLLIEF